MTGAPVVLSRHLLDAIWVTGAAELAFGPRRDVLIRAALRQLYYDGLPCPAGLPKHPARRGSTADVDSTHREREPHMITTNKGGDRA